VARCVCSPKEVVLTSQQKIGGGGGRQRCRTPRHRDRAGQLEQRRQRVGVQRQHAVDVVTSGLRIHLGDDLLDRGEVGRIAQILEEVGGIELAVAGHVVGRS
jgi:hypothetical protein